MARKDPVAHLTRHEAPPARLVDEIRALGPAAAPALRALIDAPGALVPKTPARTGASNALPLYGELGGPDAVPRLLEVVLHAPVDSDLSTGAVLGLQAVRPGRVVVDAIFALPAVPPEREESLCWALCGCEHRDPRIPPRLLAMLNRAPGVGGMMFGGYGDPAFLPALRRAFDDLAFPPELSPPAAREAQQLLRAIDHLGARAEEEVPRWTRLRNALRRTSALVRREIDELSRR